MESVPALSAILPEDYDYEIENFKEIVNSNGDTGISATIRLKCNTKVSLLRWKSDFEAKTKSGWSSRETFPNAPTFQYRSDRIGSLLQNIMKNVPNAKSHGSGL